VTTKAAHGATDFSLLERCRAGEPLAWKALYEAHFDFVYRVARRLGTPEGEVEDVCQEVFLVVFRRFRSFGEGRLTTWLYRITANVVSGRHRHRRVRQVVDRVLASVGLAPAAVVRSPEGALASRQDQERVRAVLERMAPKKREVFALYELEGLSGDEIAARVGCPLDTVWTRLHHARRDFKRMAEKGGLLP
jgi:RNA polymerase sigma-70 factor (ECF subfamily)